MLLPAPTQLFTWWSGHEHGAAARQVAGDSRASLRNSSRFLPVIRVYQRAIRPSIGKPFYAFFACAVLTGLSSCNPGGVGNGDRAARIASEAQKMKLSIFEATKV